jgi:hypothetical protein
MIIEFSGELFKSALGFNLSAKFYFEVLSIGALVHRNISFVEFTINNFSIP